MGSACIAVGHESLLLSCWCVLPVRLVFLSVPPAKTGRELGGTRDTTPDSCRAFCCLPRQLTTGRVGSNRCRPTGRGEAQSQYSIRINMQWRICFEWPDGQSGPSNVEIVDYH